MLGGPEVGVEAALIWPERIDGGFLSFISDSPLGLILYKALGLSSPQSWVLMHLVMTIVVMWTFVLWIALAGVPGIRAHSSRLVLLAPVTTVMLTGIGGYDPFTLAAMLLVLFSLFSGSRFVIAISAVALGFQHFEQGLLSLVALTATWVALKRHLPASICRVNPMWALVGLVLGRLILSAVFLMSNVQVSGRPQWISAFLLEWSVSAVGTAPLLLWSLFAGMWAVVLYTWLRLPDLQSRILLVGAFATGMVGLLLSGDRPRVFVVILAPAVTLLILSYAKMARKNHRSRTLIEILVWIAPPLIFAENVITNVNILDVPYTLFLFLVT